MKPQNLIHILIGIVCFGLLPGAHAVSPPREVATSEATRQKGKMPFSVSPPAHTIRSMVFSRSRATERAISTQPLALGRSFSTRQTKIRQQAQGRF
jgi:hypothetical protein